MKYKVLAIICCSFFMIISLNAFAQNTNSNPSHNFEVGISQNMLLGTNSVFNCVGAYCGYGLTKDIKIMMEFDWGRQLLKDGCYAQIMSLSLAHEIWMKDSFSFQLWCGPGVIRSTMPNDTYSYAACAVLGLQPRLNFSRNGFVGFDARAVLGRYSTLGSFIGVTWGIRL